MKNQSYAVPVEAAYGGEPLYVQTPYGLVRNDADYKAYLAEKEREKNGVIYSNDSVNSQDEIFDRVLKKTLSEEGGYEYRPNRIDTPTNMGIQQKTLDSFKARYPDLSQGYPNNVKDLTYNQGCQIARKDYFDKYRIQEIKHQPLQETIFDSFFNHSPQGPALWTQKAINQNTNTKVAVDGVFGSETIGALNNLSQEEMVKVNNAILDQRQLDYEYQKKHNQNPNYNNYSVGLPNRFNRFRIK